MTLCRAVSEEEDDAAVAVQRWEEFQEDDHQRGSERRFRRRSFERARDRALQAIAMRIKPAMLMKRPSIRSPRVRGRQPTLRRRGVGSGTPESQR